MCNQLTDLDLLLYLDEEAADATVLHVGECRSCQTRLGELSTAQERFNLALFPTVCPSEMRLGEYFLGTLEPTDAAAMQAHVTSCKSCQERLQTLAQFVEPELSNRRIFYPMVSTVRPQAQFALRSETTSVLPEMTFTIQQAEINLTFTQQQSGSPLRYAILGLATGIQLSPDAIAELRTEADTPAQVTMISQLGDFAFEDVSTGSYDVVIRDANIDFVLRGIII